MNELIVPELSTDRRVVLIPNIGLSPDVLFTVESESIEMLTSAKPASTLIGVLFFDTVEFVIVKVTSAVSIFCSFVSVESLIDLSLLTVSAF